MIVNKLISFLLWATTVALALLPISASRAQDVRAERDRLAAQIQEHPQDFDATYRFVSLTTELKDYEAGIGALERILMFNPKLARAQKELGFLYARLGNWELAAQHLKTARDSGSLDAIQIAQIDAELPEIEKRTQISRLNLRLQTGLRAQSNANFFPANNLFQFGGAGQLSPGGPTGDINSFQLVNVSHEYEFGPERGDQLETSVTAYATQQFRLPQYSIALFSGSVGPRFFLPQSPVGTLSVRPYALGAVSSLGSSNYLNTGGVGASIRLDVTPEFWVEPGAEWRSISVASPRDFYGVSLFSTLATLASGDATTGYVAGSYQLLDNIRFNGRVAYTRSNAFNTVQSSDQVDVQAMLQLGVDPLHPMFGKRWTIAPYGRFTHLSFDAPNPLVNPWVARNDAAWTCGVMLDAPVNGTFGFSGNIELSRVNSNIPNFGTQNVSVSFGPTVKF